MDNPVKARQKILMDECAQTHPHFWATRKNVFQLLVVMVASRVVHVLLQVVYCVVSRVTPSPLDIVMMVLSVGVVVLFAFVIYFGVRALAFLALLGGLYSLYKAYADGILLRLATGDMLFNVMNGVFLLVILIQVFVTLVLVINKKCTEYFCLATEVQKNLTNWYKSGQ